MWLSIKWNKTDVKELNSIWISWEKNVWRCKKNEIKIIKKINRNGNNNVIKKSKSKTNWCWKS